MSLWRRFRWRTDRELREEIRAHIEIETQELIERGLGPDEARRAALRRFGSPERVRELTREADPMYPWDTFAQDVRSGIRQIAIPGPVGRRRDPDRARSVARLAAHGIPPCVSHVLQHRRRSHRQGDVRSPMSRPVPPGIPCRSWSQKR